MTDSTQVLRPSDRITDADGAPSPGAVLSFYVAQTKTPLTVYSDSALSSSLGTTVTCDSGGYPATAGVKTLIYTGSAAYKVVCADADGVTLWTHDDIAGAVDTSIFITSQSGTVTYTVTPVSTAGTWVAVDIVGTLFTANPGSGNFVRTLPAASTCLGKHTKVMHVGTSNIVSIKAAGSDLIWCDGGDTSRKVINLTQRGDVVELISDGVDWRATVNYTQIQTKHFAVESVAGSDPGSPTIGLAYLVSNVVKIYDGQSNYQTFTPTTDCGWTVFDKATNTEYIYRDSAWVAFATRVSDAIGFAPVQSVRLGTEVTDSVSLTGRDLARVAGNVMTGMIVTNNTENYYLRSYYRPLQIQVSGSWATVTSI